MKKLIAGCFVLIMGLAFLEGSMSGCGSSNNSTGPVTVVQTVTPSCAAEYGFPVRNSAFSHAINYIDAYPVTIATATKTLSMAVYIGSSGTPNIVLAVYSDNAGVPNTLLDYGTITSLNLNAWNIATLTGVNLAAGTYWLAYENQNPIGVNYGSTQQAPVYEVYQSYVAPPPSTLSAGTTNTTYPPAVLLNTVCQ